MHARVIPALVGLIVGMGAAVWLPAQHSPTRRVPPASRPAHQAWFPTIPQQGDTLIDVSLVRRELHVLSGPDTLYTAPVAIGADSVVRFEASVWHFSTPRGRHRILRKRANPVWRPPDWHYAEVALAHRLRLRAIPAGGIVLEDGRRLVVRDSLVGLAWRDDDSVPTEGDSSPSTTETFAPLPVDEHIVFDATLFIPPLASRNREVSGMLGAFALDLGDGIMLHGTVDDATLQSQRTHGCIRLLARDLQWLYDHVSVGTVVRIR